ncbi:MAG: molybdopterin molybdotransferase MoeA [Pseudomonadota bacterium]|nr:molybdopterin molybdotransferase MoeA [Pseudomonadota bacterium]
MAGLMPLEQAQARLLALAAPLPVEDLPIEETQGRYLTMPLWARRTQPADDLSAMDGYAVAGSGTDGPWRVIGESAAGHPFAGTLTPGEAVRISTGALLPQGADMVVIQENCARDGDRLTLAHHASAAPGRHIRRKGMDFAEGQELLPRGARIGAAQIALAITSGYARLPVCRLPHIAIIDSGDELSAPGAPCPPHRIPASNGAMVAALTRAVPCRITRFGPVADDLPALVGALAAARDADIVVTSGGASVGDHDLVGPALREWGATIDFWKVAIKPGKPLLVARRGTQIVLGLPGNPVSSLVTAYLFLLPLLRALLGASQCLPRPITAQLTTPLVATGSRREFLRAQWDGSAIAVADTHDSGALASLAVCNTLIDRPPDSPALPVGSFVPAYLLESTGIA